MAKTIKGRVQHPVYTAAALKAKNPILLKGEVVYESDTSMHKVGDGVTPWNALAYARGGGFEDRIPAEQINQDINHRFVTDIEKIVWNGKASTAVASQSANGLMSAADKAKLDGMTPNRHALLRCLTNGRTVTPGDTDYEIIVDAADVTVRLPANPKPGQVWRIWKVAAGNCSIVSNNENAANSKKIRWVGVTEGYRIDFPWDNYGVWRVLFDGAAYLFN